MKGSDMLSKSFAALALSLFVTACASPVQDSDVSIVKARVESVEDLPDSLSPNNMLGAPYKAKVTVLNVMFGAVREKHLYLMMDIANTPLKPFEVFFLLKRLPDGQLKAVLWDYFSSGICISKEVAKKYDVEDAVKALKTQHPCSAYGGR